jgi:hypothetical protein
LSWASRSFCALTRSSATEVSTAAMLRPRRLARVAQPVTWSSLIEATGLIFHK